MGTGKTADILEVLRSGKIEIEGVLPWSSNYAFLVQVCSLEHELPAVYKPSRGERPLWDFPQGTLSLRERAAFIVSDVLGWDLVPPTVLRTGKHGPGSIQLFIAHDPEIHYFSIEGQAAFREPLQKMALLDVLINNADRKGGHVLLESAKAAAVDKEAPPRVWGIDHGICFHADYKLRTVIWEFAGDDIPYHLLTDLDIFSKRLMAMDDPYINQMHSLLEAAEIEALSRRLRKLLQTKKFPRPGPGRHYPWPPV